MTVPWNALEDVLHQSLKDLVDKDETLLEIDVNERSLTHRLAVYIERYLSLHDHYFNECNVDCEYNRSLGDTKRLINIAPDNCSPGDLTATSIYPDIIIHRRTHQYHDNNILVIEAKKQFEPDELDSAKLSKLTQGEGRYEYQFGMFIGFSDNGVVRVIRYQNGQRNLDTAQGDLKNLLLTRSTANH